MNEEEQTLASNNNSSSDFRLHNMSLNDTHLHINQFILCGTNET